MIEFDRFGDNGDYPEEVVYLDEIDMHLPFRDDPSSTGDRSMLHSGVFATELAFHDQQSGDKWSVTLLKFMLDKRVVELAVLPEDQRERKVAIDAMKGRARKRHNAYLQDRVEQGIKNF